MNKTKIILIAICVWLLISILSSLNGCAFALFGYSEYEYYYTQDKSRVTGSTWMHPIIQPNIFVMAAIPIFGYEKQGPPYSFGVRVVVYDDIEHFEKLELVNLEIISEGKRINIVSESNSIFAKFKKYLPKDNHVGAQCVYTLKDDKIDYSKPVKIRAVFLLQKGGTSRKESIEADFKPSIWKGFWKFWDVLNA